MPSPNVIFVRLSKETADFRVVGRATFVQADNVRLLCLKVLEEGIKTVNIDAAACVSMDSTFIGILAMAAIRGKPLGGTVCILNLQKTVDEQLRGLGIGHLFTFACRQLGEEGWIELRQLVATDQIDEEALRKLLLDAHRVLGDANPENVSRFEEVVTALKKEQ